MVAQAYRLGKLRQEDHKFGSSLDNLARPCLTLEESRGLEAVVRTPELRSYIRFLSCQGGVPLVEVRVSFLN